MTGSRSAPENNGDNLATALRLWRTRLAPDTTGLPTTPGSTRRTSGLRREELALLAGISVDYIVRLEQGRATSPSAQILTALARALRLSDAEHHHLFLLAGQPPPAHDRIEARLTPGLRRLLDQMSGTPIGVYDATWTLITWNPLYAALVGDPAALSARERNILWRHFTGLPDRISHTPEQTARFEAATVADLRAATARYPADPTLRALITDLRRLSPRFADLWASHIVGTHSADTKTVHHPTLGPLTLDCDLLTAPDSDLRLVLLTAAPHTEAAAKLAQLATTPTTAHSAPPPTGQTHCSPPGTPAGGKPAAFAVQAGPNP
ncbi:helix-turn-helix domain-containing protein [Streptomyces inhibens]|uniref:helix-turn-helix domain-containing protein n=1 Tax=Streptomyces inhibens TaxID=2293571 RepID=UPI0036B64B58